MNLVSVDALSPRAKNGGMLTDEERIRLGRRLRGLRVEKGLDQTEVAPKAGVSVGTLQAIEGNWYAVKDASIKKVLDYYGTTTAKLLKKTDEPVSPTHPLLKGLNEDHLEIAQAYKDARKRTREGIELLINANDTRVASLVITLAALTPDVLTTIEALLSAPADTPILELADRVLKQGREESRDFVGLMQKTLDGMQGTTTRTAAKTTGKGKGSRARGA